MLSFLISDGYICMQLVGEDYLYNESPLDDTYIQFKNYLLPDTVISAFHNTRKLIDSVMVTEGDKVIFRSIVVEKLLNVGGKSRAYMVSQWTDFADPSCQKRKVQTNNVR